MTFEIPSLATSSLLDYILFDKLTGCGLQDFADIILSTIYQKIEVRIPFMYLICC